MEPNSKSVGPPPGSRGLGWAWVVAGIVMVLLGPTIVGIAFIRWIHWISPNHHGNFPGILLFGTVVGGLLCIKIGRARIKKARLQAQGTAQLTDREPEIGGGSLRALLPGLAWILAAFLIICVWGFIEHALFFQPGYGYVESGWDLILALCGVGGALACLIVGSRRISKAPAPRRAKSLAKGLAFLAIALLIFGLIGMLSGYPPVVRSTLMRFEMSIGQKRGLPGKGKRNHY